MRTAVRCDCCRHAGGLRVAGSPSPRGRTTDRCPRSSRESLAPPSRAGIACAAAPPRASSASAPSSSRRAPARARPTRARDRRGAEQRAILLGERVAAARAGASSSRCEGTSASGSHLLHELRDGWRRAEHHPRRALLRIERNEARRASVYAHVRRERSHAKPFMLFQESSAKTENTSDASASLFWSAPGTASPPGRTLGAQRSWRRRSRRRR